MNLLHGSSNWKLGVLTLQLLLWSTLVSSQCFPAIFNFGDSTSDTGGIHASFPYYTPAEFLPYGMNFNVTVFKPRVRYSDGLLLIDFLTRGIGLPFVDPYLQSIVSNFRNGANFATAGATVQAVTYLTPFSLAVQVNQFFEFRGEVLSLLSLAPGAAGNVFSSQSTDQAPIQIAEVLNRIPTADSFSQALYTMAIGGNDFTYGYTKGQTIAEVEAYLPLVISGISDAIKNLYKSGGRNFLIWDVEPQGCLPYTLTLIPHNATDLDSLGCLTEYNAAAQYFNGLLATELENLSANLTGSNISLLSTYDLKIDFINNATENGFLFTNKACCGVPNTYNFDLRVNCGSSQVIDNVTLASVTCSNPSEYLIWDSVHNTEAANKYIANQIFSGKYINPPMPALTETCNLQPLD